MKQNIAILGSTGSIGTQALDVAAQCGIHVRGLAAGQNDALMEEQVRRTGAKLAALFDEAAAARLKERLRCEAARRDCLQSLR